MQFDFAARPRPVCPCGRGTLQPFSDFRAGIRFGTRCGEGAAAPWSGGDFAPIVEKVVPSVVTIS